LSVLFLFFYDKAGCKIYNCVNIRSRKNVFDVSVDVIEQTISIDRMDGWLGFYGILSIQIATTISYLK